jgi:hypothetical protein
MKNSRVFQITALLLVVVAVVQVGWWLLDQNDPTPRKQRRARSTRSMSSRHRRCWMPAFQRNECGKSFPV